MCSYFSIVNYHYWHTLTTKHIIGMGNGQKTKAETTPQGGSISPNQEALDSDIKQVEPLTITKWREGMNNTQIIEMLADQFVKMPQSGVLFRKDSNGEIDYQNPIGIPAFMLLMQDNGYKKYFDKTQWDLILSDSRIESTEPLQIINQYIRAGEWSGRNWIKELAANLNLRGDANENYELLNKFLCTMYATAFQGMDEVIGFDPFNRVCLILFSYERSTKKTSILRKLGMKGMLKRLTGLSNDVQVDYPGQLPSESKTMKLHQSSYFSINLDDIDQMLHDTRRAGSIRSVISADQVDYRKMWTETITTLPRRASFVATTNNPTVLRDKDENRYLVLELLKPIADEWIDGLDVLDLWRQVRLYVQQFGTDVLFSDADRDTIRKRVQGHMYTTIIDDLIDETFEYCPECKALWSEVKDTIRSEGYYNDKEIGISLRRLSPNGVIKRKTGGHNFYMVRKKDDIVSTK